MALASRNIKISYSNSSYNGLYKFVILNSTTECVDLYAHKNQEFFTRINFYASLAIFLLGIFGNLAAIYFISPSNFNIKNWCERHLSPQTMSVNQYILRSFYIISLCSVFTILLNPVLKIYGDKSTNIKWYSYGWIIYQADIHFPISKTLTSTAFQISVVLFVSQIIAIKYPFRYKTMITKGRVRLAILALLIYCFVWYIPTEKWYRVARVLTCPFYGNLATYLYVYKLWIPASRREFILWTVYDITREFMVDILPFIIMVCIKIWVIYERRRVRPNSLTPLAANLNKNSSLSRPHVSGGSMTRLSTSSFFFQNWMGRASVISLFSRLSVAKKINDNEDDMQRKSGLPDEIARHRRNVLGKRMLEEKLHKRTLLILTMEYLLLLFPVVMFDMVSFYLEQFYEGPILTNIYMSLTLLEYTYIGGTFYINLAFNPYYRKIVYNQVKKDYLKIRRNFEKA